MTDVQWVGPHRVRKGHDQSPAAGAAGADAARDTGSQARMHHLQRMIGNQAVQRLVAVQRGAIGPSMDTEDDVADRMAAQEGKGNPLDGGVRAQLEAGLQTDLSGVRVHDDGEAHSLSQAIGARAFTSGNDIFFQHGTYDPASPEGLRTLAHEATHVKQQSEGPVAGTPTSAGVSVSDPSDSFEHAAEQSANKMMAAGLGADAGGGNGPGAAAQRLAEKMVRLP